MTGIIILATTVTIIALLIVWLRLKSKNGGAKTVGTTPVITTTQTSTPKNWGWWKLITWLFILQFVVLNFIYPGGWFEVKAIFWFFATRNSDKYIALKDINTILEKDEKQKISSVQVEIEKIKGKTKLTENDKRRLDKLTNEIANVGKPTPPKPVPPKPTTKWIARLSTSRRQIEEAANMHLNQAANDKIEVDAISPFIRTETKIKFSYKKRGKLHEVVLTRDNPADEYYYGIVDLSDNTQLEMWLEEDGLEKYKGNARQIIKMGGEIIYAPLITASLEKEEIIISSK